MTDDLIRRYLKHQQEQAGPEQRRAESCAEALVAFVLFAACVALVYVMFYQ